MSERFIEERMLQLYGLRYGILELATHYADRHELFSKPAGARQIARIITACEEARARKDGIVVCRDEDWKLLHAASETHEKAPLQFESRDPSTKELVAMLPVSTRQVLPLLDAIDAARATDPRLDKKSDGATDKPADEQPAEASAN
jgi:hypothetical protein